MSFAAWSVEPSQRKKMGGGGRTRPPELVYVFHKDKVMALGTLLIPSSKDPLLCEHK